jgi:hypothetical protein
VLCVRKRALFVSSWMCFSHARALQDPQDALPIHGNKKTMNFNNILFTNIQESSYFRERCP